jgi:type II secretory pathway pseudopilin PulG
MVVVVLIGILAMIAVPAMRVARDDRQVFDYARRIEQLATRARARAAGRGAAHLLVAGPSGTRGKVFLFEALDGPLPNPTGNPMSSCKGAQFTDAGTYVLGTVSPNVRLIDGLDLDAPSGVNVDADIRARYALGTGLPGSSGAIAMCITPGGTTFVGADATIPLAITAMQGQPAPFSSFFEIRVTRNSGGAPVGLQRRVIIAGSAAARIKSQ